MSGWSNSPEDRSERARRLWDYRALQRDVRRDQFLKEWLQKAMASQRWFEGENFTRDDIQDMAESDGYRTAAAWLEMRKQTHRAMDYFVHEAAFKKLWQLLREHDKKGFSTMPSYSSGRRAVPWALLEAIQHWQLAPKLTAGERKRLSTKIAVACEVLETLLAQVAPSHKYDDQYERFRFTDVDQAREAFRVFGAETAGAEAEADPFSGVVWRASQNLRACGVVPLWAVANIKRMALTKPRSANTLPTKLRAKTAQRTFFIGAVHHAIERAAVATPAECGIDRPLMAEIVGLLANTDCSADDVRKALEGNRLEDSSYQ